MTEQSQGTGLIVPPGTVLIGIAGKARSGKDTVGQYIADRWGMLQMSFAEPLKWGLQAMLGLPMDYINGPNKEEIIPAFDASPRKMLQTLGTEWGRELVHTDIWVTVAHNRILHAQGQSPGVRAVFTDVRMPNEAAWIRNNGLLVHILRPDAPQVREHVSEAGLRVESGDRVIENNSDLETLYEKIDMMMADYFNHPARAAFRAGRAS